MRFPAVFTLGILSMLGGADVVPFAVKSNTLFVPVGFDSNDNVQVVLDGLLPDTCHRLADPKIAIDSPSGKLSVLQMAVEVAGFCFDVTVPFTSVVNLGRLSMGTYVVTSDNGNLSRNLTIKQAGAVGPDDFLYAPIEAARVEKRAGGRVAIVEGRFTNRCMKLSDVIIQDNLVHGTVEVLPRMVIDTLGIECLSAEIPFRLELSIPPVPKPGRYLLHVRSLNGKAINVVFN